MHRLHCPLASFPVELSPNDTLTFILKQLLECLASISAAMTSPAEGHRDDSHHPLSSEYWMLVRGRSVSSVLGIVVGVLGEQQKGKNKNYVAADIVT